MKTAEVLDAAAAHLTSLPGQTVDVLTVSKPGSVNAAVDLSKVVSKLSPLVSNQIEFNVVEQLNEHSQFQAVGAWKRQDPGFPDAVFEGSVTPTPGIEIKTWFPLATEITARFRESERIFPDDQTSVCLLAWLPEQLILGKPLVLDVCIASGLSIAQARDNRYHNPPDYIVLEPEDTEARPQNLQQTNTNGHKWQGTERQLREARELVESWGAQGKRYRTTARYQSQLRQLIAKYPYRLDTNFAKLDRIGHPGIEEFKQRVLNTKIHGLSVSEWSRVLYRESSEDVGKALVKHLGIDR